MIDYSRELITALAATAAEASGTFPFGGLEVGGVLFGKGSDTAVEILAFRPVQCKYASGPGLFLSPDDEAALRSLLLGYDSDSALSGMIPVGWYRSHTRAALRLSPEDAVIHDRYFPESWHVALILRPEQGKPVRAALFVRGMASVIDGAHPWYETKIDLGSPAVPVSEPATSAKPAASPRVTCLRPEPEVPAFLRRAAGEQEASSRSRKWAWIVAAALLLLLLLAGLGWWYWRGRTDPAALNLRVLDEQGLLTMRWTPPPGAGAGVIELNQGGAVSSFPLDADQVKSGAAQFARYAQDVRIQIVLRRQDGTTVNEYTRFLQASGRPDIEVAIGRAREERRRLGDEAKQAREDLRIEMHRREQLSRRFIGLRQTLGAQNVLR